MRWLRQVVTVTWCWLSQVVTVTWFGMQTVPQRLGSSAAAVFGIAGVVGVLVGVLSIGQGFRAAMEIAGSDDMAIVLRSGSTSEMMSGLGPLPRPGIAEAPRA